MECSKRHTYLTQFYRTVVDNLLLTKRREGEEEGGGMLLAVGDQEMLQLLFTVFLQARNPHPATLYMKLLHTR